MRPRHALPIALAALLLLAALAGCLGQPGDGGTGPDGNGDGSDDSDQDGGSSDRGALLRASPASGAVPLDVTFTLNASDFPDNASWELDFGDDSAPASGTAAELPATRDHRYEETGLYVARFTVGGDGKERSDVKTIFVTEPPGPPPIFHIYNGTALAGLPYPERVADDALPVNVSVLPSHGEVAKAVYDAGGNGTVLLGYEVELPEGYTQFLAFAFAPPRIVPGVPVPLPVPDYDLFVFDPDGNLAASSQNNWTIEQVNISEPAAGTWTVLTVFWAGADPPVKRPEYQQIPVFTVLGAF